MPHVAGPIEGVDTSTAALVGEAATGPVEQPVTVTSLSEFQSTFGGPQGGVDLFLGASAFFANGGRRAVVARQRGAGVAALRRALAAVEAAGGVGLVCAPGVAGTTAMAAAAGTARQLRAVFLADGGATRSATLTAVRALSPRDAEHTVVYFPRLLVADPLAPGSTRPIGAATSVAGVIARLDRDRGPWAVPAGTEATIQGASGLASSLDPMAADRLSRLGVNTLREVAGHGIVVWGARMAGGESEWRYVPVRRLALFLERSIDRGTGWVVFEPNDEPTWARVRAAVGTFLHGLFQQGAFRGTTPGEAYFVRCGEDTMTRRDIAGGVLVVVVGFAPLRPAEFVVVRIRRPAR